MSMLYRFEHIAIDLFDQGALSSLEGCSTVSYSNRAWPYRGTHDFGSDAVIQLYPKDRRDEAKALGFKVLRTVSGEYDLYQCPAAACGMLILCPTKSELQDGSSNNLTQTRRRYMSNMCRRHLHDTQALQKQTTKTRTISTATCIAECQSLRSPLQLEDGPSERRSA